MLTHKYYLVAVGKTKIIVGAAGRAEAEGKAQRLYEYGCDAERCRDPECGREHYFSAYGSLNSLAIAWGDHDAPIAAGIYNFGQ